jgi:DNA-binding NtrC family response regulator
MIEQVEGLNNQAFVSEVSALGRLLVIEDDPSICRLIEKLGEKAGFTATTANSFDDAVRLLGANEFDCITLDLLIGTKTGVAVLQCLADMGSRAPIIVISGSLQSGRDLAKTVGNMLRLNLLDPLAKPIDFTALRTTLARVKERCDLQRNTTSVISAG